MTQKPREAKDCGQQAAAWSGAWDGSPSEASEGAFPAPAWASDFFLPEPCERLSLLFLSPWFVVLLCDAGHKTGGSLRLSFLPPHLTSRMTGTILLLEEEGLGDPPGAGAREGRVAQAAAP